MELLVLLGVIEESFTENAVFDPALGKKIILLGKGTTWRVIDFGETSWCWECLLTGVLCLGSGSLWLSNEWDNNSGIHMDLEVLHFILGSHVQSCRNISMKLETRGQKGCKGDLMVLCAALLVSRVIFWLIQVAGYPLSFLHEPVCLFEEIDYVW